MNPAWTPEGPIFQQLSDQIAHRLLEGDFDGREFPSVRDLARQYLVNPLLVTRALARLVSDGLIENSPGESYRLAADARSRMIRRERQRVLDEEWPAFLAKLKQLGLSVEDLAFTP